MEVRHNPFNGKHTLADKTKTCKPGLPILKQVSHMLLSKMTSLRGTASLLVQ